MEKSIISCVAVCAGLFSAVPAAMSDQVIFDDLIVVGSACVGFDCTDGETFGFDTIKLKENNLRIFFEDTSVASSFPTNDWAIEINDSADGGMNFFSIVDRTANQTLLRVCAVSDTTCTNIIPGGSVVPAQVVANTTAIAGQEVRISSNTSLLGVHETRLSTLDNQVGTLGTRVDGLDARMGDLDNRVGQIDERVTINKDGVAIALALGGGAPLLAEQNGSVAINYGNFNGASAFGVNAGFRLNDMAVLNGAIGVGTGTGTVGGRIGAQFSW
ncbi:hypothetical protein GA830_12885 [Mesorhizobium sp. NBSH29]|uniref:YadA-like family protein n=1 Tax=Mesorhizobium sp. NBSH29 TaxID=2654249 RepID=UPI0018966919|nr:YadA-like family protein [Mesorhizobium sp. NBSH29]QPC87544.1 hypothetical protein GA830_12885 [Mesorhizobium sp. NBSH29]